jgi:alpha-1,6-mannosyltransferase
LTAVSLPRLLALTGLAYAGAILFLIVSKTPLGSPSFFVATAVMTAAYGLVLWRVWGEPRAERHLLYAAFALAVGFRLPPALAPVGSDNDMVRYLWDGRVQRLGYNPYGLKPSDPALAHTHTAESSVMPSRHDRTPYPPAAQLFFRLVVTISDSTLAMKLALVVCDLLTMIVLWRWLIVMGRSEWLTLAYAWNPLVVLEVSHSGHIDALGALWIVTAAFWLTRRRTLLASIAFVLAIASKLLPIVLAPLFIGRIRVRDAVIGVLFLILLYLPFASSGAFPLGAVPNVVDRVRFNSPVFSAIAAVTMPRGAAAFALIVGLAAATWARWRLDETDPAAWAWPMALALVSAPVIYSWYLLYLTPFLFTTATLPLTAWTISALSVYEVWERSRQGGRWIVPTGVVIFELGTLLIASVAVWLHLRGSRAGGHAHTSAGGTSSPAPGSPTGEGG